MLSDTCSCEHAEISIAFVSDLHLPSLLALAPRLKKLKMVVAFDEPNRETKHVITSWAKHRNLEYLTFKECEFLALYPLSSLLTYLTVEDLGKANLRKPIIPTPDSIYSICYTSVRIPRYTDIYLLTWWLRVQQAIPKVPFPLRHVLGLQVLNCYFQVQS
jgi:hypothetical protein